MPSILWIALSFVAGSIPFSHLLGRYVLSRDIRKFGDGNPGATNLLRAGGRWIALVGLLLDFAKGAFSVAGVRRYGKLSGSTLCLAAVAPVLGHAATPWLRFRGGKAVAVTGGVWCGLTAWEGPTIGGLLLGLTTRALGANGWAVIASFSGMLGYLSLTPATWNRLNIRTSRKTNLLIGLANLAILAWKHADDLRSPPPIFRT